MAFLVSENKNRSVEGLPPSDFYLNRFVLSARRKSGVEYKTSTPSLRGLISWVYRHLMRIRTCSGTSTEWPSSTEIWIELELEIFVFEEMGKPEYPEKNLSEQRREPTTNSTHILRRVPESISSKIGGRPVLSPRRYPCSWKQAPEKTSPAIRQHDSDLIMTRQAFAKSRDALKSKQKQLERLDKGNKRLEDSSLNQEEIDPLFNWRVMGIHSPQELINTLWFNNSLHHSNCEEENNSSLGEMSSKQRQY
mgnify:CR=1 FL=1